MRLLLDEMYPAVLAEQLRVRGHDVASLRDSDYRELEGQADEDIWASAIANERALVTENVGDFRRVEALALARCEPTTQLILTTDRSSPAATRKPSAASCSPLTRFSPRGTTPPRRCTSSRPRNAPRRCGSCHKMTGCAHIASR